MAEIVEMFRTNKATYYYKTIKCGKKNCTSCPHGPYWYAEFIANGRTIRKYIGKSFKLIAGDDGIHRACNDRREPIHINSFQMPK